MGFATPLAQGNLMSEMLIKNPQLPANPSQPTPTQIEQPHFTRPQVRPPNLPETVVNNPQPQTGQIFSKETIILISSAILISCLAGVIIFRKKTQRTRNKDTLS